MPNFYLADIKNKTAFTFNSWILLGRCVGVDGEGILTNICLCKNSHHTKIISEILTNNGKNLWRLCIWCYSLNSHNKRWESWILIGNRCRKPEKGRRKVDKWKMLSKAREVWAADVTLHKTQWKLSRLLRHATPCSTPLSARFDFNIFPSWIIYI